MENAWQVWWKGRSGGERYGLLGGVAVVVLVAAFALYWALRPGYQVLFSGLDPKDATGIANQLALEGIKHELDAKGGRILVAKDDVHAARIKVMERGLSLSGPVGFELFDEADFGMTDFTQQINYQRALEGELARTIMALDEIEYARLHLVLPEGSLFRRAQEKPKASLTVVVAPGATLTPGRVTGIQRLIAAAVPGLEPASVTVHDQMGVALTRPVDADGIAAHVASERLEAKQLNEAYLTKKAQEVLDRAFGVGAAAVIVDVSLDHNRRQNTREETLPVQGGVTGAVIRQRTSSGARPGLGAPNMLTAGGAAALQPMNAEVEYAVGRNVEQLEVVPGGISRVTVGVLVPRGLDSVAQQRMSELVASAVGLDFTRGDSVSMQELPAVDTALARPAEEAAVPMDAVSPAAAEPSGIPLTQVIQLGLAALALVALAMLLAVRLALARGREYAARPLTADERERLLADLQRWLESGAPREARQ